MLFRSDGLGAGHEVCGFVELRSEQEGRVVVVETSQI